MSSTQTWQTFLAHSLATRLEPETFSSYVQILSTKHPLPPSRVSDLFLRPTDNNNASLDPRIPRYVQVLLGLELITVPSILRALWRYSSYGALKSGGSGTADEGNKEQEDGAQNGNKLKKGKKDDRQRWTNSYAAEEMLFYRLAKHVSSGTAPRDIQEAVELLLICIQWMEVVTSTNQAAHEILSLATSHTEEMNAQTMALGTLVVAVVENGQVLQAIGKGSAPKGTGKELSKALENFVPLFLQNSPQSAARLELFRTQTLAAVEPAEKKDKEVVTGGEIDDILDESMGLGIESVVVQDLPTVNSRAGLYVYLNSLVIPTGISRV
jgi:mediator of RNA polymerase II transcription subunit 5